MSTVRTYSPSVRVGNWNEDLQLEEDTLKDFLERKARGELLIQQASRLNSASTQKMDIDISRDGCVHYGDNVMVVNPHPPQTTDNPRSGDAALAINSAMSTEDGCGATASVGTDPSARTCLVVESATGATSGEILRYGEVFHLRAASSNLYLASDKATFSKCAKMSRHNEVSFINATSYLTKWKITPFDPSYRLELDSTPVQCNERVLITHVKTGHHLCLEAGHQMRSAFGMEYEVSTYTSLNSHKVEKDINHWVFAMKRPGDGSMNQ